MATNKRLISAWDHNNRLWLIDFMFDNLKRIMETDLQLLVRDYLLQINTHKLDLLVTIAKLRQYRDNYKFPSYLELYMRPWCEFLRIEETMNDDADIKSIIENIDKRPIIEFVIIHNEFLFLNQHGEEQLNKIKNIFFDVYKLENLLQIPIKWTLNFFDIVVEKYGLCEELLIRFFDDRIFLYSNKYIKIFESKFGNNFFIAFSKMLAEKYPDTMKKYLQKCCLTESGAYFCIYYLCRVKNFSLAKEILKQNNKFSCIFKEEMFNIVQKYESIY